MPRDRKTLGPYSRTLRRGAIGASLDGRSTTGRFVRDLEAQLVAHVGGAPTITQKLLIGRIVTTTVQLAALDEKLASGSNWTDCDTRTHAALVNRQRLLLRELGMKPAAPPVPSLAEHLARRAAEREAAA